MNCPWCLTHWFQFQCSRITAKKRTWETLREMFTVQSLSGNGEKGVSRVEVWGALAFLRLTSLLIPFRCGLFSKTSLQLFSCSSASPPHRSPFLSPSELREYSACLHLRVFFLSYWPIVLRIHKSCFKCLLCKTNSTPTKPRVYSRTPFHYRCWR